MNKNDPILLKIIVLTAFLSVLAMSQVCGSTDLLIPLGKSIMVPVQDVQRVLMVKEGVLEVLNVSDDEIILSATGDEGASTQVIVWDARGQTIYEVTTFSELQLIKDKFKALVKNEEIELAIFHDEAYLSGTAKSIQEKQEIEAAAKSILNNFPLKNHITVGVSEVSLKTRIELALKLPTVQVTVIEPPKSDKTDKSKGEASKAEAPARVILNGTVRNQRDYMYLCETMKAFATEDNLSNLVSISDPTQVVFQAYVLEVTKENAKDLGITWGAKSGDGVVSGKLAFNEAEGLIKQKWNPLKVNNINRFDLIAAQVEAWETQGKVKVMASPKLMVYANATPTKPTQSSWFSEDDSKKENDVKEDAALAYVSVGQRITYAKTLDQAGNPVYDYIEASLKLSIRDMFRLDNKLKFTVFAHQEEPNFLRGTSAPPNIMSRSIMTTINMENEETVILGGLINKSTSVSHGGVPGLKRLPLVGSAFRNKSVKTTENELIILLTPKIDTSSEEAGVERVRFEREPVPHRSERLKILSEYFDRIKSSHTNEGEQQ
jgi:Flp pilus assembly secretin CpaC